MLLWVGLMSCAKFYEKMAGVSSRDGASPSRGGKKGMLRALNPPERGYNPEKPWSFVLGGGVVEKVSLDFF